MIRKVLLSLVAALTLLIGVVLFRTFTFGGGGSQTEIALPQVPSFNTASLAEHVSTAIQHRTITLTAGDPRPGQDGAWRELEAFLKATYPDFHATAEKIRIEDYTLLFRWQGSDASLDPILLMAHQDVVPVNMGTEGDWDAPPFSGAIQDGYVYGRGTLDDKASLVTIMEAAEALVDDGFQPTRTILIMLGHDEEVSGSGARAGVAWLKEQGITAEMVLDEGFVVVDPFPLTGGPTGLIGIAEKGYVTLQLTSVATGGHSSTPPRNSANVQLSRAIVALDENQMPADLSRPPISTMIEATAGDMSFVTRMVFANRWLFQHFIETQMSADGSSNAMIRTTTAPTMMVGSIKENVLPQNATALVNFRIHPNDSVETVLAHVRDVVSEFEGVSADLYEVGGIASEPSPVSPTDNRPYAVLEAVARETGGDVPVAPALVMGATDARWTTEISSNVYRFAPSVVPVTDLNGFHGTNERISVENLGRLATGYAQIMKTMASE